MPRRGHVGNRRAAWRIIASPELKNEPQSAACRSAVGHRPAAGRIVTSVEQEANEQQAASAREFVIKVEDELQKFRHGILALMDKNLIPSAITGESKMSHYAEDGHVAYAEATKITEKSIDEVVDMPVVLQRQEQMIQKMRKTVEDPQVRCIDKISDASVVTQRGVPTVQTVQKTAEAPQIQLLDRCEDVPVVLQRHVPVSQEQILERVVEETGVPVPRMTEEIIQVPKHGPQE